MLHEVVEALWGERESRRTRYPARAQGDTAPADGVLPRYGEVLTGPVRWLREDADLDIGAAGKDDAGAVLRALEAQAELL